MRQFKMQFIQLVLADKIAFKGNSYEQVCEQLANEKIPDQTLLNKNIHQYLTENTNFKVFYWFVELVKCFEYHTD
jgi:hypothetical protein